MSRNFRVGDRVRTVDTTRIKDFLRDQIGTVVDLQGQRLFVRMDTAKNPEVGDGWRFSPENLMPLEDEVTNEEVAALFGLAPPCEKCGCPSGGVR